MSVGILVPSYDGYADVWPIAANLFRRFWPDRQWPMYWMTNGHPVPEIATPIVRPVTKRQQWGHDVAGAVTAMPEPLVLFWFEEILLLSAVPNELFLEAAEILRTTPDVGIVQLTRYYNQPDTPTIGHFADWPGGKATGGFCSAMPALFRKDILLHLLNALPQTNDFEQQSAKTLFRDFPNLRSLSPCVPTFRLCDNAVIAGLWCRCVMKHMNDLGLATDYIDWKSRGISPNACGYMDGAPA